MSVAVLEAREPSSPSRGRWKVRVTSVLLFALVLYALGNIGRIPLLDLGSRQAPLLINDLCVMAVVFAGAVAMGNARSMKVDDTILSAVVFAAIGGISAVLAIPRFGLTWLEVIGSLAYLARWLAYFALYVVVINCVRGGDVERVWKTIEGVLLTMAAFGIFQAVFLSNFAFMVSPSDAIPEWDAQRNRLVSTILDPNIMAGLIAVVLLVVLSRMAFGVKVPLWKPLLLFAALLATLSRGGLLSFAVGASIILAVRGVRKRMLRVAAVVVALVVLASPWLAQFANQYSRFSVTDGSALARVTKWQMALGAFLESPWFGIGFNTYGFVQERRGIERLGAHSYSAEGGLLFIAVMTGVVGLCVYLAMLWSVMRRCRSGWLDRRSTAAERGLHLGVGAATVCVLVNTLFVNTLLVSFMMELLWVLWGVVFVMGAAARARRAEVLVTHIP